MSTKTYIMSMDTLKSIGNGALGALTFGAYNLYLTTKTMELNNEINAIKHKYEMEKQQKEHEKYIDNKEREHQKYIENTKREHDNDINELKEQIKILQTKSKWW